MGKQRRKRTQYHFGSNGNKEDSENTHKPSETSVSGFNIDIPENIFNNVDIDMEEVNKNLISDDSKSVRSVKSISKSVKSFKRSLGDVHLKKVDKRTLRRNLFLKKIQHSYENLKTKKQDNKNQRSSLLSIPEMDKFLPSVDLVFHKPKTCNEKLPGQISTPKPRGIAKAKTRKKAMINNLNGFKKLLEDVSFKSNPMDVVTNCIERKVFEEEL